MTVTSDRHQLSYIASQAADARLNAWILAWDQHAFATQPSALFDANIYYPARNALAASEHLLAVAALLLPLRALDASPVLLHQAALVGSSLLLALTSAALVRWLTGSSFAAFVARLSVR